MKVITLLPVKNEAWILKSTLKNMSDFSDFIVIADQDSTDASKDTYAKFEKVTVIQNNNANHNNSVRWQLLDYAREKFGSGNLIICVDADEMIQPEAILHIKNSVEKNKGSVSFAFPWIQLWGASSMHRVDSVWKNNYKSMAFFDDGIVDYKRTKVLNDHTGRVPTCAKEIRLDQFPLLHYQYVHLKQAEIKQAWYRCSELISGNQPRKINYKYSFAANDDKVELEPVHENWLSGLPNVLPDYALGTDWRYKEIMIWFDTYGIKYFEPLCIWQTEEFRQEFMRRIGRDPKPKKYPGWLIKLNTIKNKMK